MTPHQAEGVLGINIGRSHRLHAVRRSRIQPLPEPCHLLQVALVIAAPIRRLRSSPAGILPLHLRRQPYRHVAIPGVIPEPSRQCLAPQHGIPPTHLLDGMPILPREMARRRRPCRPVETRLTDELEPFENLPILLLRDDILPQPILIRHHHAVPWLRVGVAAALPHPKRPGRNRAEPHRQPAAPWRSRQVHLAEVFVSAAVAASHVLSPRVHPAAPRDVSHVCHVPGPWRRVYPPPGPWAPGRACSAEPSVESSAGRPSTRHPTADGQSAPPRPGRVIAKN